MDELLNDSIYRKFANMVNGTWQVMVFHYLSIISAMRSAKLKADLRMIYRCWDN